LKKNIPGIEFKKTRRILDDKKNDIMLYGGVFIGILLLISGILNLNAPVKKVADNVIIGEQAIMATFLMILGILVIVAALKEKINVDTEELMKVLRRARAGDRLIITSDDANLILTFEGEATRQFKIRLIDIEYETPQPPEIRYENEFEVPFSLLKDAIADIDIFSDKITFQVDEEKFIISSKGEFGDAMIEYYHGEKIKEPARSVYSLDKIREMLKADRFSETATINLGNDMPLKLTLKMPEDEGELSFLLAPRLEAEE